MRFLLAAVLSLLLAGCCALPTCYAPGSQPTLHTFHDLDGSARTYGQQQGFIWQQVR